MKNLISQKSQHGTVLILVLWALAILSIFALQLASRIQQKTHVLSRLEKKDKLRFISSAGIDRARLVYQTSFRENRSNNPAIIKKDCFDNPEQFKEVAFSGGYYDVHYQDYSEGIDAPVLRHGFIDEESKININKVDRSILKTLIAVVLDISDAKAGVLASAIIDWRMYGESEIVGFFSDQYYENLEFSYVPKKADFETLDEILLVNGVAALGKRDILLLMDFLTIYGDGKVNVNTASKPVLAALGLTSPLIDKILRVRRGEDKLEATKDDYIFQDLADIRNLDHFLDVFVDELTQLNDASLKGHLGVSSSYFKVQSVAVLSKSPKEKYAITCVFHKDDGRMFYWREE